MTEKLPTNPEKKISPGERDKKIKGKIAALFNTVSTKKMIDISNKINSFATELRRKYPNSENYTIFHALLGSTLVEGHTDFIEEDFPGGDSVEKFIEGLEEEYKTSTEPE